MQLFNEAILIFCTVKLHLWDVALTESGAAEVEMFLSTVDQEVNAGSTVNLSCVAYGSLSAPSIEWTSVTGNGRTSTIRNSIKHDICNRSDYTLTESTLRIEDSRLEDTGEYSCIARLNGTGSVLSAKKTTTLTVLSDSESTPTGISKEPEASTFSLVGPVAGGIVALLLLIGALSVTLSYYGRRQFLSHTSMDNRKIVDEFISNNEAAEEDKVTIVKKHWDTTLITETNKSEASIKGLIVHKMQIQIMNLIGEGEFGHVYEGKLQKTVEKTNAVTLPSFKVAERDIKVAVKTLKGSFNEDDIEDLIRESVLMHKLDHPNIIPLIGLCLDAGPSPYIILPFMKNGSLLSYIKKNRAILHTNINTDEDKVTIAQKQLTDMCLQIAKGMEYLANMKLIHRDLAARNCMIDENWVIKVADFGLSEVMTASKDYFREIKDANIKLPVKWMAPESLHESIFSEKSDVWSYGVTCWEIFTTGKSPYPGVHPMTLARELDEGRRLYRPDNIACSDQMYTVMKSCWEPEPEARPGFSELVQSIGKDLQGMTDYLYVSAFGFQQAANTD